MIVYTDWLFKKGEYIIKAQIWKKKVHWIHCNVCGSHQFFGKLQIFHNWKNYETKKSSLKQTRKNYDNNQDDVSIKTEKISFN